MKTIIYLGLLTLAGGACAAPDALPRDRLNLTANASVEVTRDVLGIAFSTSKEGSDAAVVQAQLKQALDAALAEARKIARPGQVEVQTGNFSLYPRYAAKGGINGWQGNAELLVEGKDVAAIAQLSGRISSMSIARVGYSLSKEQREKVEGEVTAQAIAHFKARAADYARQFGFNGYSIGEVTVNSSDPGNMPMSAPPMRFKAMAASADEALPVEAGKASVSVTVNGSVLMTAR
ncbi:SIMPL domain-containing protein [Paucibacter sp. B2R-40]|uniref:SIMPL domain-containing protein n=1 Tax=Paucibacter sp. B2R-40 TaxID=2893554 RepID=UPI0021E3EF57|nr:SIMPL domain-containing protein [Paucibacter sp. B2R-40]MCV2354187.1 SIMPL domain-containing protein [Paucibacter sp. B2R-40]